MSRPTGPWAFTEMFYKGMEKVWSNTLWWGADSFTPYMGVNPAEDFFVAWAAIAKVVSPPSVILAGCRATINSGIETIGYEYYGGVPGTNASTIALPEDVAVVVQRISDVDGESGRGRMYLSGVSAGIAAGSYLSTGGSLAVNPICAFITTIFTDTVGNAWAPKVYSRKENQLYNVTQSTPVALLGTSRRRRSRF